MRWGSVFTGLGMLDYGLTLAGMEHAWMCEADPWRRELLAKRWPGVPIYPDIREIGAELEPVEGIVGGFPCKGISGAGRQEGFGHPETVLWREQLRLIRELRPRYCLVENVAALLTLHDGECFHEVISGLAESGYSCWWDVLPAAAVGAPHLRERVFVVAHAPDLRPERSGSPRAGRNGLADGSAGAASDPDQAGRLERGGTVAAAAELEAAQRGPLADASSQRRQQDPEGAHGDEAQNARRRAQHDHEPASPGEERDAPSRFDWGAYVGAVERWEALTRPAPEPLVCRVDDGASPRVVRSRLSGLGDGVQVQVGELVGRMILEHASTPTREERE